MKFLNSFQSVKFVSAVFLVLLFFGALFWAKSQDPFSRQWFTLKTSDNSSFKCVAVLPKPIRLCPVVIYAHGSDGTLMNDGCDLRQMAELGLATVSLEYNQTNETAFTTQFEAILRYLDRQKWANTNAIAWLGFSLGANLMLDVALKRPEQQPQLLVQLSGAGLSAGKINNQLESLHCPVLLVHGEMDEVFPLADTKLLVAFLQTNGLPANLKIIPGASHGMKPERGVVFRNIGEYCLSHLTGKNCWENYHSIAQWQAEAPPLWLFWLPAAAWIAGWLAWWRHRKVVACKKIKLKCHEVVLRWLAVVLAAWAFAETAIHLATPHFSISDKTLAIARRFLVQSKERADFEYLAEQPILEDKKLETLLEHVELAGYNRELINWQVDDKIYRDFILSPVIARNADEQLNWRRPLWEEFYPRIRHENSPEDAAPKVFLHLRSRVTIADLPNLPHDVPVIWRKQITDKAGFEFIYVAALRSIGVPSRLNSQQQAEFWDGNQWRTAPAPYVSSW